MKQLGFFDFDIRLDRINKAGDPLVQLNNSTFGIEKTDEVFL